MTTALWWFLFTLSAIWAQSFFPGVDCLAPGLIVCLQKDTRVRALWLALAWVVVQEGTASLSFGYALAQYACLTACFVVGRWLFEGRNVFFICMLGLTLGLIHHGLATTLARFQDYVVNPDLILRESLIQVALFPVIWFVASELFPRRKADEQAV